MATLAGLRIIVVLWHINLVIKAIYSQQIDNLCIVAIVSRNLMD